MGLLAACGGGTPNATRAGLHAGIPLAAGATPLAGAGRAPSVQVVAPRYMTEYLGSLGAWREALRLRLHTGISFVWHAHAVRENLTVVTLQLVAKNRAAAGVARWSINFPLNRPLSASEQQIANGDHGVGAMDAEARALSAFPPPTLRPHTAEVEVLAG